MFSMDGMCIFLCPLILIPKAETHPYSKVIPREQLYSNLEDTKPDYECRYGIHTKQDCYCCGMINTYVEHGDVCTKFCLVNSEQKPRYGQKSIINLPDNFDGNPIKIRLDNDLKIYVKSKKPVVLIEAGVERRNGRFISEEQGGESDFNSDILSEKADNTLELPLLSAKTKLVIITLILVTLYLCLMYCLCTKMPTVTRGGIKSVNKM